MDAGYGNPGGYGHPGDKDRKSFDGENEIKRLRQLIKGLAPRHKEFYQKKLDILKAKWGVKNTNDSN